MGFKGLQDYQEKLGNQVQSAQRVPWALTEPLVLEDRKALRGR